ncbi:MAG TPA: tRNA (adenosine(37)-N6)-dimethylallyltransferase MiaA, partial [Deinococcales bacterium]|nr:tRNA (adenosine(37)-N6)-dimethylallyltransferase MiaA [Deinococcales bacterium]
MPDGGEAAFPFPPVPVLGGLTASGKTALAVALARDYPVTVVSADAMMVYRGLDVGTAKPTPEERALAPHLLLDVLDVTEDSSVGWWAPRAEEAVRQVVQAGRIPLVVGGTGFYLRALTLGRPNVPPSRPERIAALEAELERVGLDALAGRLRAASPLDAERAQRNPRRVLRALEVLEATGRPPSAFGHAPPAFPTLAVALMPPVETVDARIELR